MKRTAFTLIDLVAATALTGILMVMALSFMATMVGKTQSVVTDERADWVGAVKQRLTLDLMQASRFSMRDGQLVIHGIGHSQSGRSHPVQRPAVIRYYVTDVGEWLLREETYPQSRSNLKPNCEIVCHGITRLKVKLLEDLELNEGEIQGEASGVLVVLWGEPEEVPLLTFKLLL